MDGETTRDRVVTIRFSDEEHEALRIQAEKEGFSGIGTFIRVKMKERFILSATERSAS